MYYPKSQIQTGLITNGGEYIIASTGVSYAGPYWITSQGETFSGENPTAVDVQVLLRIVSDDTPPPRPQNRNADTYYVDRSATLSDRGPKLPIPTAIKPTEAQYGIGEYRRYFFKKTNEILYGEIDAKTYTALVNRDAGILWQLYYTFDLPWTLVGDAKEVFTTNRNIVQLTIQRNKLTKFAQFLKNDYLKYYRG